MGTRGQPGLWRVKQWNGGAQVDLAVCQGVHRPRGLCPKLGRSEICFPERVLLAAAFAVEAWVVVGGKPSPARLPESGGSAGTGHVLSWIRQEAWAVGTAPGVSPEQPVWGTHSGGAGGAPAGAAAVAEASGDIWAGVSRGLCRLRSGEGPRRGDSLGVVSVRVIFTAQEEMRSPAAAGEGLGGGRKAGPGAEAQLPPAPTPATWFPEGGPAGSRRAGS